MFDEALSTAKLIAYAILAVVALGLLAVVGYYVKPVADVLRALLGWLADFAKTTRGQIIIVSLCVCAGVTCGLLYIRHQAYQAGYAAAEAKAAAEAAEALQARREFIATMAIKNADAGKVVDERLRAKDAERAAKTITIIKEVPRYVTPAADARCTVPAGFVLIHESARAGLPPAATPSAEALNADSGVALSAVAANYAATADLYRACADQVAETQAWYEGVRERFATMRGAE